MRVNYVPKEGGNAFRFSFFGTGVNSSFQGNNYSDELRQRELAPRTRKSLDTFVFQGAWGETASMVRPR